MDRGKLVVERVGGKSTLTRCLSKYPFKFIAPNKVGPSQTDAVWIYTVTYGGGIVSGDSIACDVTVGDGCTAVLTTQSSTKILLLSFTIVDAFTGWIPLDITSAISLHIVMGACKDRRWMLKFEPPTQWNVYKSIGSKCSEQLLEASIGRDALLVVIPDPVTCFSTARYSQAQIFKVVPESSLLFVDWLTSGRLERGEKWAFSHYKSTNRILFKGNEPVFLDTILLEQGSHGSISDRLQDYQAIAMIVLFGPKLKLIQNQIQEDVKKLMSQQLRVPSISSGSTSRSDSNQWSKPSFLASCSTFGPKGIGVVVRVASMTTESVYNFLQRELASMEALLGASPYR